MENPNQPAPQQQQEPQALMTPRGQEPAEGGQKMDPKAQQQYDMFAVNALKIIHEKKVSEGVLSQLSTGENPIEVLAAATLDVVMRLATSAKESGQNLSVSVVANGGNLVLSELLEITKAAGMQELTEEQKTEIMQLTTAQYLDQALKMGLMTEEEFLEYGKQAAAMPQGAEVANKIKSQAQAPGAQPGPPQPSAGPSPGGPPPQGLVQPQGGM